MRLSVRAPRTVCMRTRDGVRLDADVYWPDVPGPFPVLLMRQPYGRRIASTVCYAHPEWYAAHGYIVAVQDVRGRGTSEGMFRTFEAEAEDGADAIAWAATLPGASGAVGMYGFSYQGTNQLLAAGEAPPALRALAPAMIGWDLFNDWACEGGAFALQGGIGWALQIAAETARRDGNTTAYRELRAAAHALPLSREIPARPDVLERHRALTHYHAWLDTPADSPYWNAISPASRLEKIVAAGVPTLLVGGWFDSHLPGTLAAWRALAGKLPARIVIGPWAHFPWGRRVGVLDFSVDAISDIDRLQVRWFDHWLKGGADSAVMEPAVRLFDMGALCWRDLPQWPSESRTFFVAGTGRAALDERDGTLLPTQPESDGAETLVHDPWRPAPGVGAARDRAGVDARPDVLTFTTAPAEAPLLLAGDARALLDVTADAPDFDVACALSRVAASGQAIGFAEGYRRVATPGPVEVPMRATCLTLQPGERLRLSIAAAAFPSFPVNPGTGENPTLARMIDARVITLRVRHGSRVEIGA
jgi:putative CocE/NonD family hydrolase